MWWIKRHDPRVGDEIRYHRDRLIEDYMASGMDRQAAERRAFLEFGNAAGIEEQVLDVRGRWLDDLGQDLRYTLRTLRRTAGFSAVAILSLALGIGANAAVFALINGVMLQTLPVADPDRLVVVARMRDGHPISVSYPLFELLRREMTSLAGAFVRGTADLTILIDGDDDLVSADLVSGNFFTLLGLEPAAGRLLVAADDSPASVDAAVISDAYWQRRFGRSPSAVGRTFAVRDRTFTIVGVTPPSFRGVRPDRAVEVFLPVEWTIGEQQRRSADFNALLMMGRLKPGATVEQANAEAQALFAGFVQAQAASAPEKARPGILRQRAGAVTGADGLNAFRYAYSRSLFILMGIVGLVLLLACVNLSGLLLARAAARRREISIRLAMGAGRGRLARQFLTESFVLAVAGGGLGLAWAGSFSSLVFRLFVSGREIPPLPIGPGWRVLAFTSVISLLACLIVGLAPAWQAVRVNVNPALKEARAHRGRPFGRALVVLQLAISMILLVGATLFIGTLVKLNAVDRGLDADHVLVITLRSAAPYPASRGRAVQAAVLDGLRALPGVQTASAAQILPLTGGLWDRTVQVEGYQFGPDESEAAGFNVIAPQYFAALGTPVVAGREFGGRDAETSPKVAIVNEAFARQFFGSPSSALGRHVTSVSVTYEIVGVVRDGRYQNLRDDVLRTMYIPWTQRDGDQPTAYNFLIRSASSATLSAALERVVRDADPALRVRRARPYAAMIGDSIATERVMATLGGVFGALALVVAALGVFGVLAFRVARQTNELGVRLALGASRLRITAHVLRDVAVMVAMGIAAGSAAAVAVTRVVAGLLFELTPTEPLVFAIAGAALAAAALAAGWLPARRASRVDPLVALRHE